MKRVERFRALLAKLGAVEAELRAFDHVHHVDVGFRYEAATRTEVLAWRLFIHGPKHAASRSRNLAPRRIRGIPTDVIAESFQRHESPSPESARIGKVETLVGGVSFARAGGSAGTLGLVVRSHKLPGLFALTSNHIAGPNEQVFQPAQMDSAEARLVGETCAISLPDMASLVRLHDTPATEYAVLDLPAVTGVIGEDDLVALCAAHAPVTKSGRTTAVTVGELDGLSATGTVAIANLAESPQPEVAGPGDSGSIWMTEDGRAVALHYAGVPARASAQAMWRIAQNLDLSFAAQRGET